MTTLEEEFKKLLGNRYHQYTHLKPYERPSISELNKNKSLDDLFKPSPNILLNNESDNQTKDIIFNLNRLSEQSLYIDNEFKEKVNELLEKVDKIIEYIQYSHKQIDEKISKAIGEQLSKR